MATHIELVQTPAAVITGRDPQLDKALEVVMAALKRNPAAMPKRLTYSGQDEATTNRVDMGTLGTSHRIKQLAKWILMLLPNPFSIPRGR